MKTKYILKDNLNTYISMHNTEDEVYDKLQEYSNKEYITFYFFKFDLKTNKRISLY